MPASLPYLIHLRFNQALIIVRSIPEQEVGLQPIPTDRLKFYGLYKQATFGECNTTKPSLRNVVEYAKWKAWYRVRHHSCMEAKNLYVNLLVELLVEFINRYPNNPHHEFAKQALHSLESNVSAGSEVVVYARKPIIPDSLPTTIQSSLHDTTSTYFTNGSWFSKSPSSQASTTPSSVTTNNNDAPWIPDLTYHHHTQKSTTPSTRMMSIAMDLTRPDAAAMDTARIHPTSEQYRMSSSTTTFSTSSPSSSSKKKKIVHQHQQNDDKRVLLSSSAERKTLEKLHMDIAELTNQMNHLGQYILSSHGGPRIMRHNYMIRLGWRLVKTLLKHLLVNTLMTGFVFWVLWHQQSPTIHAMVDFLTPHIKALVRSSIKKTVFWKLKV